MIQFYFLSIVLNVIAGLIILFENSLNEEQNSSLSNFIKNETFRLILGILLCIIGIFKLLSPIYNDFPIIGDLLPALTNILAGMFFLISYFKQVSMSDTDILHPFMQNIIKFSRYIGIMSLVVAVLHFLFPTVLLL